MLNIMVKSKSEHLLKLSKLFMILDHPTYGSHQVLVHQSLVYSTTDSILLNHPPMLRTELNSKLPTDLDLLMEFVEKMLLPLQVFPSKPFSEKSPKNQEFPS